MIHFECQHCGRKLKVPEGRAGRKGRCPACKAEVVVPQPSEPAPVAEDIELIPADTAKIRNESLLDQPQYTAEDREQAHREDRRLLTQRGVETLPEHTGERKLPWPIDILLYPANSPGLMVLAFLTGIPLLMELLRRFMPVLRYLGLMFLVGSVILGLYAVWYFAECVYDSAKGGTRAPQFTGAGLGEMWSRVSYLIAVYIVYLFPAILYRIIISGFEVTGARFEIIFWALAGYALVFFPMGLLAMVVNDSISALNPFFLLGSILRTFFHYAGLLLFFAALGAMFWLTAQGGGETDESQPVWWLEALGLAGSNYGAFVVAHILGRFYWRNRERLDWGL
jgi:hypothetical protein